MSQSISPLRLLAIMEAHTVTGPAKNLLEFATLARPCGVETTIVTFTRGASVNLFTDTVRAHNIRLETIAEKGAFDRAVLDPLRSLVDRIKPDVIQTHAVKSHFLARYARLPQKAPWVAFHHGYTWPAMRARFYNQLDRWSLPAARQVLTVSAAFRNELAARGVNPQRIEIVHNAIEPAWGLPFRAPESARHLREQMRIAPDRKVILIVGRLAREKDHLALLQSVALLRAALRAHLVIVGDGPERPRIERKIRELNMTPSVSLTGQQDSAAPYYGIADVAVLSSRSEGSPNALLEAMAAGVPVVATRVGGVPEIVTHEESALLVPPGDPVSMSRALARLLTGEAFAQRLASRASELVRQNHAPEVRAERLVRIYTKLAAESDRTRGVSSRGESQKEK